jgi:crossover junction endodeoxyribonuclease RusA
VIELILPWPPSINHYWRHPFQGPLAGRHLISEKGRVYRHQVLACVLQANPAIDLVGNSLAVHIIAHPPDRRRRDLDNLNKAILDSLVFSKVIEDDGLIDKLIIERGAVSAPGYVTVAISVFSR